MQVRGSLMPSNEVQSVLKCKRCLHGLRQSLVISVVVPKPK